MASKEQFPWGGFAFLVLWLGSTAGVFAYLIDRVHGIVAYVLAIIWSVVFPLLLSYWTWLWRLFMGDPTEANASASATESYAFRPRCIELSLPLSPITTLPSHLGAVFGASETYDQERGWVFRTDWFYFPDRKGLFLVLRDEELKVLDERFLLAGRWLIDTDLMDAHAIGHRSTDRELAEQALPLRDLLARRQQRVRRVHRDVVAYSSMARRGLCAIPEYLLRGRLEHDALVDAMRSATRHHIEIEPDVPSQVSPDRLARWLESLPTRVRINGQECPGWVMISDVNYGALTNHEGQGRPAPWSEDRQTFSIDAWDFDGQESLIARNYTWVAGKGWYRTADYYR